MRAIQKPTVSCTSSRAWRVVETSTTGLRLAGRQASMEVAALAKDLFRVRVVRAGTSPAPSWVVIPRHQPPPVADLARSRSAVELSTCHATFAVRLRDGSWTLRDRYELEVFTTVSGGAGFSGTGPRLELALAPRESLLGLGETTGAYDKRGQIKEFWNSDVLGHAPAMHPALRSLYVSIPFAISCRDGRFAGLFWDNPSRQVWDLGCSDPDRWRLSAESGDLDLYLFAGPTIQGVLERYTELTGRMPMPPRWALGFHQSRYSYRSRNDLESVAKEFRRRGLPCDALYCDIHHMDRHRVFTFGKSYPDPASMMAGLSKQGFKVVAIANPGVKDDPRFGVLRRGRNADAFVKAADGKADLPGEAWPGRCRFPDFFSARVRTWWGREQQAMLDAGIAGIWNDMNEPANFGRPDKTLEPDAVHRTEHGLRRHREVHNLYGMFMARASREGMLERGARTAPAAFPSRPFVVSRAGFAGIQRHSVVWTGDNSACWEHLSDSLQMLLNLGLSGVPFVGADVGGFLGNPTPELFVRWFQMAAFTPFFRTHSNIDTRPREPWAFGPEIEAIARDFLCLRYQLVPYLYGLVREASRNGTPIMRPLAWHFPNDPVATSCTDEFLVGESILVAPVLRPGMLARSVYLPRGEWYDFWSGELLVGGAHVLREAPIQRIPLLVRAGAMLPMIPPRPHLDVTRNDTHFLHVWPRDSGRLEWYDDDGISEAHASGIFRTRTFSTTIRPRGGRLEVGPLTGPYQAPLPTWRVVLRGVGRRFRVRVDGKPVRSDHVPELEVLAFDLPTRPDRVTATWSR